ncbi:DNA circularization N-terminal domain-containing protein [Luteibacter aegosomaticola]|uniref:DNA circularization protein n=1 Tax=Luteibacter aegosomaticola TaxID=2911538 RepID=UPI001FF9FF70|nr:DNA circularization N-terminal domain-containing protein [Luteibacter aegosomaticola]UPG89265.1 DNA circularization N-terminal domain-containing protein [Luteibacter aegosomaticola]
MSWFDELRPASFRGVPFAVLGGEGRFGRRVAVHEYPGKDRPYVEDLGRSTRRIGLVGFLVEDSLVYGGGSVMGQRDRMIAAVEQAGPGILVHPTLGELRVSVPDGGLGVSERWDQGRYFELSFSFIESGERVFPSSTVSNTSLVGSLIDALGLSAAADFVSSMTRMVNLGLGIVRGVVSLGNAVVAQVVAVSAGFQVEAGQAARDATNLANLASLLTGNFGRYQNANVASAYSKSRSSVSATPTTITALTAQGAQGRAAVTQAGVDLMSAAAGLDGSTVAALPAAAQGVTSSLASVALNPGDGVRLFTGLAVFQPDAVSVPGQTGAAMAIAQDATASLFRRCAIGELARAAIAYAPSSHDDADAVRDQVTAVLDSEILHAGDIGDDQTFLALRELRQALVAALSTIAGGLSAIQDFRLPGSSPALAVAQRLYQDATRADELVAEAVPIHPAFMPTRFRALAR